MSGGRRTTLFGVATGTPDGGVAVVRISGPDAGTIGAALTGPLPEPRRLARRALAVRGGIEDALVVWMPGPASFTGEDVVELHVHAGLLNVELVCAAVAAGGAVAAGPGDFSRRAFELGRMGLDQAEGLAAVIGAHSEAALAQARRLAAGELGRDVDALRERIVELQAEVEANLDFPEDVEAAAMGRWREEVRGFQDDLRGWLGRFESGRRARSRPRVVLAGPVNAGKSSLFNALLDQDRALVSAQPGTTRDYVEAELRIDGYVGTLVDTAGLRRSDDAIESAGVRRSGEQIAGADVVLWIEGADSEPVAARPDFAAARVIEVETKRDLGARRPDWIGAQLDGVRGGDVVAVTDALRGWFGAGGSVPWIGLSRHRDHAEHAVAAVQEAAELLGDDAQLELAAFALGLASHRLGEITGRVATGPVGEEVLARIFARFCIGK